ncbi:Transcription initiation factor TFIID, 23-30kDa subunit [Corchorus olitorius]|uniref:Transcription initiation factor TFIID, 23-30kDa subunit n=1 Tax=Corchorus olitorius TaxID=93759 RepID=A0A1R3IV86_9ROSI|nr:Transcription initiation factor TFIID, 23-30kDa subunit [Corchorus olitorius]
MSHSPLSRKRAKRREDAALSDMLATLMDYTPTIPDELVEHCFAKSGSQCPDARLIRLVAIATQKFVADVASDALQHCKATQAAVVKDKREKQQNDKRLILTMDDLSKSFHEYLQRWAIIKKRFGNLNLEGTSTASQLSEAQLATPSALFSVLGMPDKNLTAVCTNNPGLTTACSNSALISWLRQGRIASVEAQNQPQQGPSTSVSAKNQPQKGPNTALASQNQHQQGPTTSVSAKNQPKKSPNTALPSQNQPQQGFTASVSSHNQRQPGPTTSISANNQRQPGPMTSVPTTALPAQTEGPSTSVSANNQPQKGPITALPSQNLSQIKKPAVKSLSILDATAVATGARIAGVREAKSLLKAAQSKNAIRIMTSGASSVKHVMPMVTPSQSKVHSNVQYVSADLTTEPVFSPVATSSTLHPGSVRSAIQRAEDTPSPSSSLNVSIQQSDAVTSSPTVEGPVNEEEPEAAGEDKGSVSDSLPRETIPENRACVPQNDTGETVDKNEPAVSNQESDLKNHEGEIRVSVSDSLHKEPVQENGACMPQNESGEGDPLVLSFEGQELVLSPEDWQWLNQTPTQTT